MDELLAIDKFLYQRLAADATLTALVATRIDADLVPDTTMTLPLVTYSTLSAADRGNVGIQGYGVLFSRPVYIVKAVGEARSYNELQTIVQRLHTLIQGQHNTVVDGFLISSARREGSIKYPERLGNTRYNHLGGLYRFFVEKV